MRELLLQNPDLPDLRCSQQQQPSGTPQLSPVEKKVIRWKGKPWLAPPHVRPHRSLWYVLWTTYHRLCDAPKSADGFSQASDGFSQASEGFPLPLASPPRTFTPPAAQYSWRIYDRKEVCLHLRTLKPSKTSKEEEKLRDKHLKDFLPKSREKTMTSLLHSCQKSEGGSKQYSVMREYSKSKIKPVDHVSRHTNDIYSLKLSKTSTEKAEVKSRHLELTNYDVMVDDDTLNSDVINRGVNKPIAGKSYAPRKHSLVPPEGFLKSSLRVCSQTFTKMALILAIAISIWGGLFNIKLPERKSKIGTSSSLSPCKTRVALRCHGYSALSLLREPAAAIIGISEGLCSSIHKVIFLNESKQLTRCMNHHHWRGPWAVRGSNDIARQHLLNLSHFFSANCGVLPPVGLAERGPMGLNPMLQQRSITQVVVTLAEDVLELLKQLVELLLLERGEALWEWRLARFLWRMRGGRGGSWCFLEVDHLEDAYTLPCVKLKGLRPVIVHGIPELWTT